MNRKLTALCVWIAAKVGTPVCVILFMLIPLVSLPGAIASGSLVVLVQWFAGVFLQLVLLPLILVASNAAQEAAAGHRDSVQELHVKHEETAAKVDAIAQHLGVPTE